VTRSRKIIATVALTMGVLGGMAGPALADAHPDFVSSQPDNHPGYSPSDAHPDLAPPENHPDFMPPPPANHAD